MSAIEFQDQIGADIAAISLHSERKTRLKSRVMDSLAAKPDALVLASEQGFISILPGIAVKKLQDADGRMTSLWRLAIGARIPSHGHSLEESCLVLEGQLEHAGRLMQQGDFLGAASGEFQQAIVALRPSLLLIQGESRF